MVFSDLHLGAGGRRDDFRHNGSLMQAILSAYYLPAQAHVILNGDIEEHHRSRSHEIREQWEPLLCLFDAFAVRGHLDRIWGNHDPKRSIVPRETPWPLHEALLLQDGAGRDLMVFHGHQAHLNQDLWHRLAGWVLRFLAHPLGIPNYAVSFRSPKRYAVEQRVYHFARSRGVLALIGHTHRPLFESMSKRDRCRFRLEALCRCYPLVAEEEKGPIEREVRRLNEILQRSPLDWNGRQGGVYDPLGLVPCLFNSGCGIGRKGLTCLELSGGELRLVYWFDGRLSQTYLQEGVGEVESLDGGQWHRVVLARESLDVLFARLFLLGQPGTGRGDCHRGGMEACGSRGEGARSGHPVSGRSLLPPSRQGMFERCT